MQLCYWYMLSPLGNFSQGYQIPEQKSHLNAVSCTLRMAWNNLDTLFEEYAAKRIACIRSQYTMSGAFDNWQETIPKGYQGKGKASLLHRGTATLTK